jgi:hypothetical protein
MNLNTDKNRTSLKGVYAFYSVIITLCVLALFVFNLNIYAKAVLCALILLCVLVMRSLKHALPIPPNIDTDTMQDAESINTETVESPAERRTSTIDKGSPIDTYLTLLIETDEELSNDPSVDTSSPNYNNLLNHRIGMKLNAMSQSNNPSNKD